jgi:tetratricopeptide (TPR) repeat protein
MQKGKVVTILALLALETWIAGQSIVLAAEPKKRTEISRSLPVLSHDTEAKLRAGLKSIDVIMSRTKPGPTMEALIVARSRLALSLAQKRILGSNSTVLDAETKSLLLKSRTDALRTAQSPNSPPKLRAEAYFVAGEADIYMEARPDAEILFQNSMQLDPSSKYVPLMAFFIAEEAFDKQDYERAKAFYARCIRSTDPQAQKIALYKTSWCWLKQEKIDMAVQSFVSMIRKFPNDDVAKDARRDLAFIVSRFAMEEEVLSQAERLFPKPSDLLEFLRIVEANREQQGKGSIDSKVLQRVVELEKDPIKRVEIYLGLMSVNHKDYAAPNQYAIFVRIHSILTQAKVAPASKQIAPIERLLDDEIQRLARSYIDTFSGKMSNPEKLTKAQLSEELKSIFSFYSYYFQQSKFLPTITQIWLDVCESTEDWTCVVNLNRRVQANSALASLREKSSLSEMAAYEQLSKKDLKANRPLLIKSIDQFLKQNPKSSSWIRIAKRRLDLRFEDKEYSDALPLLDQVLAVEPNEENFYRSQWARYQLAQFDELGRRFKDTKYASLSTSQRLQALKRETLLEVAKKAREKGDASSYTDSVKQFIAASADPEKAKIARQDLLNFYIEKQLYPQAVAEMVKLSPDERLSKEYVGPFQALTSYHLKQGDFQTVVDLFKGIKSEKLSDHSLLLELTLAKLGSGQEVARREIDKLDVERRVYLHTLMGLTHPQTVVSWFKASAPKSDADRKLALLALRLNYGQWVFTPTKVEESWVKDLLPAKPKKVETTPTERRLKGLWYPSSKARPATLAKAVERLATDTRAIRELVKKDIVGKTPQVQRRIFEAARANEEKLAHLILSSPIPNGLSPEQQAQYKAGVEDLAKEFSQQAEEFGKIEAKIDSSVKDAEQQELARTIPVVKVEKWPWPSTRDDVLKKLVEAKNSVGALIVLDLRRKEWFSEDEAYYWYRTGILLSSDSGEVMRRYLFEELSAEKQDKILSKCQEMSR